MTEKTLPQKVTIPSIQEKKSIQGRNSASERITALTAYDFTMAKILDSAGVDIILVGDSLASVVQGLETTIPVTLDEMIYHCRCVSRGVKRALVVGDLPFMSYQVSAEKALESAGRMLKEGFVSSVKLEGGIAVAPTVERLVAVDIPVMGHIGLTPQSYHRMGGHKVQGRSGSRPDSAAGSRERLFEDAKALQAAGAFAIVIEGVPENLAAEITEILTIPTIGIGAGKGCDGQILVTQDMLGFNEEFTPRFVKKYADLHREITEGVVSYISEVKDGSFPSAEHSFKDAKVKRNKLKVM